jgi:hypothetical protein
MGMMKNGNAGGANDLFEGHQGGRGHGMGGHGKGNGKN